MKTRMKEDEDAEGPAWYHFRLSTSDICVCLTLIRVVWRSPAHSFDDSQKANIRRVIKQIAFCGFLNAQLWGFYDIKLTKITRVTEIKQRIGTSPSLPPPRCLRLSIIRSLRDFVRYRVAKNWAISGVKWNGWPLRINHVEEVAGVSCVTRGCLNHEADDLIKKKILMFLRVESGLWLT